MLDEIETLEYKRLVAYLVAKVKEQIINQTSEPVSFKVTAPGHCTIDRNRVTYSDHFRRCLYYVRENVPDGIIIEPGYGNKFSSDSMFTAAFLNVSVTNDYWRKIHNEYCEYLIDFHNLLVTNRKQEINQIYVKLLDAFTTLDLKTCEATKYGFSYRTFPSSDDSPNGDSHNIISFFELGLKQLSSYSQVYTLAKLLSDMLSQSGVTYETNISSSCVIYYPCGYSGGVVTVNIIKKLPPPITKETVPLRDW